MDPITIALLSIVGLVILILLGVHVGFGLALMSFVGVWLISGRGAVAVSILSSTAFESIRDYIFAVVPLFLLMGCFMSNSGAATDLFKMSNRLLKKIPGGMGIATVAANAVFAAVTGVSVASAAVFSKIALPEMKKLNYNPRFAVGTVAGSSVLGMLIPPSVLMIIYGMLAEVSIGKLFLAGFVPGIVLAAIFSIGIILIGIFKPDYVGGMKRGQSKLQLGAYAEKEDSFLKVMIKPMPVIVIIVIVLGGIWGGFFTPTEASAVGALGAFLMIVGKIRNAKRIKVEVVSAMMQTAESTATIFFLLIAAQMYSRMLTMSGLVTWLTTNILSWNLSPILIMIMFCVLWLILGCIIDSTSILLLTMPLMVPIVTQLGMDLIWFGIIAIIVIEVGLITPPFGMVAFSIKGTLGKEIKLEDIFAGSIPFMIMMMLCVILLAIFPMLVTWLPSMM